MLGNVLVTDNSSNGLFHSGKILIAVLVQCICLGNGCVYFGVISTLVLQGGNGICDGFRHVINFGLLCLALGSVNSFDSNFNGGII